MKSVFAILLLALCAAGCATDRSYRRGGYKNVASCELAKPGHSWGGGAPPPHTLPD